MLFVSSDGKHRRPPSIDHALALDRVIAMSVWDVVVDIVIPFAAILVPTGIAILLFRAERKAAAQVRAEEAADRKQEKITEGIRAVERAMNYLIQAGYEADFRDSARVRFKAVDEISLIKHNLGPDNDPVWKWIVEEVQIVARGLGDRDDIGLLSI
ncbi:MAG: hypothetical protein CMH34_01905 [Microbacterium sp.]|nr:hypothetical protein [Microbacterium sp.]